MEGRGYANFPSILDGAGSHRRLGTGRGNRSAQHRRIAVPLLEDLDFPGWTRRLDAGRQNLEPTFRQVAARLAGGHDATLEVIAFDVVGDMA